MSNTFTTFSPIKNGCNGNFHEPSMCPYLKLIHTTNHSREKAIGSINNGVHRWTRLWSTTYQWWHYKYQRTTCYQMNCDKMLRVQYHHDLAWDNTSKTKECHNGDDDNDVNISDEWWRAPKWQCLPQTTTPKYWPYNWLSFHV